MPLENKEVHTFGNFEDFHQRKEGSYSVILNTIYALKKGSPMIDKAKIENTQKISIPESILQRMVCQSYHSLYRHRQPSLDLALLKHQKNSELYHHENLSILQRPRSSNFGR